MARRELTGARDGPHPAKVVRVCMLLLCAAVGVTGWTGCTSSATTVRLSITVGDGGSPSSLAVSVYDRYKALIRGRATQKAVLPGTLLIDGVPAVTEELRHRRGQRHADARAGRRGRAAHPQPRGRRQRDAVAAHARHRHRRRARHHRQLPAGLQPRPSRRGGRRHRRRLPQHRPARSGRLQVRPGGARFSAAAGRPVHRQRFGVEAGRHGQAQRHGHQARRPGHGAVRGEYFVRRIRDGCPQQRVLELGVRRHDDGQRHAHHHDRRWTVGGVTGN